MSKRTILVPPDGGYGWVIVFAGALNNFVLIPLLPTFGLIFKEVFPIMGLTATQGSLIINVNLAFGMITGFLNGPLLNHYGCRKVAFVGAVLSSLGIILTSFARSFLPLMFAYGIIASLGLRISASAYNLAVNMYFTEKRNKAIGTMIFLTGFGPIFLPQITNLMLQTQSPQGVTLIIGGICLHSFIAAMLLHPVEWHMKKVEKDVVDYENEEPKQTKSKVKKNKDFVLDNLEEMDEEAGEPDNFKIIPLLGQESHLAKQRDVTTDDILDYELESTAMFGFETSLGGSVMSLNTVGLRRSRCIPEIPQNISDVADEKEVKPKWKRLLIRLSNIFDLDLFKDAVYVNIMVGMSIAVFSEMNFSNLTAFILTDYDLDTTQIATFMSTFATADVIFRFIAPYVGDYLKQPPRKMFFYSLLASILFRSVFMEADYYYLLGIAVFLGITRGFRSVYLGLIIPHHIPIERLAAASGIQLMVNGIIIIVGGPLSGVIRDRTGSYQWVIIFMNILTFATIIMWSAEYFYKKWRRNK